jgi:hypothetical protein
MSDAQTLVDEIVKEELAILKSIDFSSKEATTAIQNIRDVSTLPLPAAPEPEAIPEPPTTILGKLKAGVAGVWDSETTRVLIKAGGAFAGVALVTWTTIHRDHVIERQAMSLATQRNS